MEMEHILNMIEVDSSDNKIKVSITESTMMQILHRSMDKAYQKVKSKKGVLECLNEISKFYELAVLQLEGCLNFVQEERGNYDFETSHEFLLKDLTEIKDRLQRRLKEVELAISDKDNELSERSGNEMKLKKALKMSEKRMDSLYADLKEHRKIEGSNELFLGSQASIETRDREDEFCELKHSVDQQVWNIQQQLEPNYQIQDEERNQVINHKKIEQMGSDLGILKETLDLAFTKMQNAIFLSELGPIEHQWMSDIERSVSAIVIKGSRESFEDEMKKQEVQASLASQKHLADVIREINCLNQELRFISNPDDAQVKSSKSKGLPRGRCFSGGHDLRKLSTTKPTTTKDDDGSLVTKMIKNHGSTIRRKSDELNLLTKEILRDKSSPLPPRKGKDIADLKRCIREIIVRLENLINLNPGIGDCFSDNRYDYEMQKPPEARPFMDGRIEIENPGVHSMEEIWEKVTTKTPVSEERNEDPWSEIRLLKQEMEDSNLQNRLMEETYLTLLRSFVDEFHMEMLNHHIHFPVKENMYENLIEEMKTEWNEKTRSEKYDTLFAKPTVWDLDSAHNSIPANHQTLLYLENTSLEQSTQPDYFFRALWDDIYAFLLRKIIGEWRENIETFKSRSCLGEELCLIVFGEIVRGIINTSNSALIELQQIKVDESSNHDFESDDKFFETAAMSIKDDVLKAFLADMIKEHQMEIYLFSLESLIKEDIFQFVLVESVKHGCTLDKTNDRIKREQSPRNSMISVDNLAHILDSLVKFFEDEEALILTAYSETKQQSTCCQHVASGFEFNQHNHRPGFFTYEDNSTNSTGIKLEKALLQLDYGKALLSELGSELGITVDNLDSLDATRDCRKPSIEESLETFIQDSSQTLQSFEFESFTRLGRHALRLDEMKGQLDKVAKIAVSHVQKESLYKKAFIRRCENLQMAEAEEKVDGLMSIECCVRIESGDIDSNSEN
ncbi:Alpha/beta-Hydrolases superfamily protein [Hibiscus syriacus]|uniref:Alpha/beta-Hydrolases superfamily protein n=1 Tax=Hibiscus syriacus TaxID=106335 RepID=A0A6A3BFE5_HIBSY|nr:Alpha/beta-Hydrolases superfamily protein [Hibiscus syriacus]